MTKLCEFTEYCTNYTDIDPFDNECGLMTCCLDISKTPYHDENLQTNDFKFGLYRFVRLRKCCNDVDFLIPEGRAYINGFGQRRRNSFNDKSQLKEFCEYSCPDDEIDMLYINCKGKCYPDCDLSYKTQDNWVTNSNDTVPDINRNIELSEQIKAYNDFIDKQ